MPGPAFPKDLLFKGKECGVDGVMEIIRKDKRLKSALCSSDANPNDGETADSAQMSMKEKKKKRKKRSKTSLSCNDEAQEHNEILQDVRALTAVIDGNLRSGSCNGEALELVLQKPPQECWPQQEDLETPTIAKASVNLKITDKKQKRIEQEVELILQKPPQECWPQQEDLETPTIAKASVNLKITDKKRKRIGQEVELVLQKPPQECRPQQEDLETPTIAKASVNLKITDKKRKRIEQELQKVVSTSATIAVTKETGREDDRVWKYVCKRAVLVDPKGHIRTSFSALESSSPGQPNVRNKKTIISEVSAAGKSIVVTITKEGVVAQDWILRQQGTVFGLDAEWRPSFTKGSEHKVALLQICGESECLIIQMLYLDVIPWALVDFLKDPNILFPGVGVKGDAKKLQKDWGLECNGAVDLTSLAVETLSQPELKHVGLKALANIVIGYEMAKTKRVTMSNWAKPVLDNTQVEYATLDAWVSYAIHQRLVNPPLESGDS